MKRIFLILAAGLMAASVMADRNAACDVIYWSNNDSVQAKVLTVGENEVTYHSWSNLQGPTYTISKSEIIAIRYANGSYDIFDETYKPVTSTEKAALLTRDGNTYYSSNHEVLKKHQMLDWYARHNCQAAYDQFAQGLKLAKAGWACFAIGLAMDVGSVVSWGIYISHLTPQATSSQILQDPAYIAALSLGVGAFAFEIACIPTLVIGYQKMHRSVDVYNVSCTTAQVRPYWTLQASSNGIGLAMKF